MGNAQYCLLGILPPFLTCILGVIFYNFFDSFSQSHDFLSGWSGLTVGNAQFRLLGILPHILTYFLSFFNENFVYFFSQSHDFLSGWSGLTVGNAQFFFICREVCY